MENKNLYLLYLTIFLMPIIGGGNSHILGSAQMTEFFWILLVLINWGVATISNPVDLKGLLKNRLLWPAFAFVIWMFISLPFSDVYDSSIRTTFLWISILCLPLTILQLKPQKNQVLMLLVTFLAGAVVASFYGIYQAIWGFASIAQTPGLTRADMQLLSEAQRPFSFFKGANIFGGFLLVFVPISMLLFFNTKNLVYRILLGLSVVAVLVALLLSYSRGAWICMFLSIIPLFGLMLKKQGRIALVAIVFVVFSVVYVFWNLQDQVSEDRWQMTQSISERFKSLDSSARSRVGYWKTATRMGNDNILFGGGLGTFADLSRKYQKLPNYSRQPHNILLKIYAELGFLGLAIFIFILVNFVRALLRQKESEELPKNGAFLLGLSAFVMLLHGLIDIDFSSPAIMGGFSMLLSIAFLPSLKENATEIKDKDAGMILRVLSATSVIILFSAVQFLPIISDGYYDLSRNAMESSSSKQAFNLAKNAEFYWPVSHKAVYHLGRQYLDKYSTEKSEKTLKIAQRVIERSIELNPGNPEYHIGLADVLAAKGYRNRVVDLLGEASKLYPASVYYQTQLAKANALSGNKSEALSILNNALKMEADYLKYASPNGMDLVTARFFRAAILNDLKRWEEAKAEYQNIIELCDKPGLILHSYTSTRKSAGSYEDIKKHAQKYIDRVEKEQGQ